MTGMAGFDWHTLVDQLIQVESYPLRNIDKRIDAGEARKEAWSKFDSLLKDFRAASRDLLDRGAFNKASATVGTASTGASPFKATVTGSVALGSHRIEVVSLAEAEVYSSAGFSSSTDALNVVGSFTINGKTINVNAGDSLSSIRDAINSANAGVSASVLETVSGAEYKLVIKSDTRGAEGIEYSDAGVGALLGLSVTVEGTDAELVVDGLTVKRKSNTITDVIQGVTLDLYSESHGEKVSLTLASDQEGITESVEKWIDAYNQVKIFINQQQTAPEEGRNAPPLFSDSGLKSAESALQSAIGFDLYRLGITRTNDGLLDFDKDKFMEQFNSDPESVELLFQRASSSTNPELTGIYIPVEAKAGTYDVSITSVATRASLSGTGFDGTFNATGSGDRTLSITDASSGKTLDFVVMDAESVSDLVSRLNQELKDQGIAITASVATDGVNISLAHDRYGSEHGFSLSYTDPNLDQLGLAQGAYSGTDVQGTINGQAATGAGQELVSDEGVRFRYTGVATGAVGSVEVTTGAAARVEAAIYGIALNEDSMIVTSKSGIDRMIDRLEEQKLRIEDRLLQRRALLERQFYRMEQLLSAMQSQNAFIMAGLGNLMMF